MLKNKRFSFFLVCVVVFDANYNIVSASCSTANEENECCWLVRYEGLVKSINDRPGFQAPITEAFQVGIIKVIAYYVTAVASLALIMMKENFYNYSSN